MTGWHALKVVELKKELKSRGLAQAGLKQELIDRLVEDDGRIEAESKANERQEEVNQDAGPAQEENGEQGSAASSTQGQVEDAPLIDVPQTQQPSATEDTTQELPPALVTEESQADDEDTRDPVEVEQESTKKELLRDDPFLPETTADSQPDVKEDRSATVIEDSAQAETIPESEPAPAVTPEKTQESSWRRRHSKSDLDTSASTRVPTPDILDDQRKRKRRSASPPPDTQDVMRKKARTQDQEQDKDESMQESESLKQIQAATQEAELSRQPGDSLEEEVLRPMEASSNAAATRVAKEVGGLPTATELNSISQARQSPSPTPPPQSHPEHPTAPSRHAVTQSLYIRKFKRPLHIPTLRSHISTLARLSDSEEDQVKLFFLDTIRTHAFISFKSKAAASQVRNALHDTRFPDEPMREPLWIDFIPDEKVQSWIDEESDSGKGGFGGSRTGRKFEVRYEETADGVTASLYDSASDSNRRPAFEQQRSRLPERPMSDSIASGVHPDRAGFVAHQAQKPSHAPPKSDTGKGFKALDELFESTTTKPKLYYKLPEQSVINDRLDMVNALRVGHGEMGKSGDEGMKRYSFENHTGQEEWVDKGPEFGFGRRGQDRLTGFRGGRGGPRGARRGGGDSWRGR